MAQWYFHNPGQADRLGPLDDASARAHAQRQPDALAGATGSMAGRRPVSWPSCRAAVARRRR